MPGTKEKTDLEILTGNDFQEVGIKGNKIRIEPVKLKNLSAFSRASKDVFGFFAGGEIDFQGISERLESVSGILVAGSPLSEEEVGELDASEAVALLSAIVAVNASFFVSSVLPAFQGGLKTLVGAMAGRK